MPWKRRLRHGAGRTGREAVLGSVPASCRALAGLLDAAAGSAASRTPVLALGIAAETLASTAAMPSPAEAKATSCDSAAQPETASFCIPSAFVAKGMARPESLEPAGEAESPLKTRHMVPEAASTKSLPRRRAVRRPARTADGANLSRAGAGAAPIPQRA